MLWKLPNDHYLLQSKVSSIDGKIISISDYAHFFYSENVSNLLSNNIFNDLGEFYEIQLNPFIESKITELLNIVESNSNNSLLKFHQENPSKIIKRFSQPATFSLEDYLYLNNLHVVENNRFINYFISEQYGGFSDIKIEILYDCLVPKSEILLPPKYLELLIAEFK